MKQQRELADILKALDKRYAGKTYTHLKSCGQYIIISFSYREEDLAVMFHYHPVDQPALVFSRPFSEFSRFKVSPSPRNPTTTSS